MAIVRVQLEVDTKSGEAKLSQVAKGLGEVDSAATKAGAALKGEFAGAVEGAAARLGPLGTALTALGPAGVAAAAGIALTGGAALTAAGHFVAMADGLDQLQAQTGASYAALQQWQLMAQLSGVSVEQLAGSSVKLQRALVENADAFARVGLSAADLRQLAPEEAMQRTLQALHDVGDGAIQASRGVDIFGKSWEQLSKVANDSDAMGARAATLGDDVVEAGARVDTALTKASQAWATAKAAFGAGLIPPAAADGITAAANALGMLSTALQHPAIQQFIQSQGVGALVQLGAGAVNLATQAGYAAAGVSTTPWLTSSAFVAPAEKVEVDDVIVDVKAFDEALKKATATLAQHHALTGLNAAATGGLNYISDLYGPMGYSLYGADGGFGPLQAEGPDLGPAANAAWVATVEAMVPKTQAVKEATIDWSEALRDVDALFNVLGIEADSTLGRILGGTTAAAAAFQRLGELRQQSEVGLTGVFAGDAGLGALLQGLGAVGTIAGTGFNLLSGLIQGDHYAAANAQLADHAKARESRDDFIEAQGGLDTLIAKAEAAGVALDDMFAAKGSAELEAALERISGQLDTFDAANRALGDAMGRYGFTNADLSGAVAQQRLDQDAGQLLKDFELLKAAGVDVQALIERMGPQINEYVQACVAAGTVIPEAMRPVVEQMLEAGLLTDAAGNKLESLDGLTFGETTSQFDALITKIGDLVDALLGVPKEINVHTNYTSSGTPPPGVVGGGNSETGGGNPFQGDNPKPGGGSHAPGASASQHSASFAGGIFPSLPSGSGGASIVVNVAGAGDPQTVAAHVVNAIQNNTGGVASTVAKWVR